MFPFARIEPGTDLCAVTDIADPGAISVVVGADLNRADIVVLRHGDDIRAYVNSCPHAGTPLETFDGRFFDADDPGILVCSTHGARFRRQDGFCISGPCQGLSLRPVPVRLRDGRVATA